MRITKKNGSLTVQVISGTYAVLFGMNIAETHKDGVLGFAIERTDHTFNNQKYWLAGFKTFKQSGLPPGRIVSTNEHPIQAFLWGDYTTRKNHRYTYRFVVMRGQPGALQESEEVSIPVSMQREKDAVHEVYFNRGVGGSQAYVRKFGNRRPDKVGRAAYNWLSRGLFETMRDYIRQAKDNTWAIHAAVYEFQYLPILKEFKAAINRGAKVMIIFDDKNYGKYDKDGNPIGPWEANRKAFQAAGISADHFKPRRTNPSFISHNKFIVLLKDGVPNQVWTGSTNITRGGIFGHSNVGHLVRDEQVASSYEAYWQHLLNDPRASSLRSWTDNNPAVPTGTFPKGTMGVLFSPRGNLKALEWYAKRMENAGVASFLTAAFGVNDLFEKVFFAKKKRLRYLMLETEDDNMEHLRAWKYNRIAIGNVLEENMFERWLKEQLTGFNLHVRYIHTKYMLVDPLGEEPLVITGSANFSDASTRQNDESMLIISGEKDVSDIYLTEFMRLFMHFYFRMIANRIGPADPTVDPNAGYLKEDDSWISPYYDQNHPKCKERLYFAGANPF
jgi:phosphatidylserine/phosphatidylglycerophosphate/cardiolipin synthase-like enzyme